MEHRAALIKEKAAHISHEAKAGVDALIRERGTAEDAIESHLIMARQIRINIAASR